MRDILLELLQEKGYVEIKSDAEDISVCEDMDIYEDIRNILTIKQYSNWIDMQEKWEEDQIRAFSFLKNKGKYNNNCYLFITLEQEVESQEEDLRNELQYIEKDEYIMRKYILFDVHDIDRIPILSPLRFENIQLEEESREFKEEIMKSIQDDVEVNVYRYINFMIDKFFEATENEG